MLFLCSSSVLLKMHQNPSRCSQIHHKSCRSIKIVKIDKPYSCSICRKNYASRPLLTNPTVNQLFIKPYSQSVVQLFIDKPYSQSVVQYVVKTVLQCRKNSASRPLLNTGNRDEYMSFMGAIEKH